MALDSRINLALHLAGHLYSSYKSKDVASCMKLWDEILMLEDVSLTKISSTIQIFTKEATIPGLEDVHGAVQKYILETGKSRLPLAVTQSKRASIASTTTTTTKKLKPKVMWMVGLAATSLPSL